MLARTLDILGSGVGREVVWQFFLRSKTRMGAANKVVPRFKETGHLVFKSISALSRGILKKKKGKSTIHFNGDSMNAELLVQTHHSANQLSVYGAVANWCHQFGFAENAPVLGLFRKPKSWQLFPKAQSLDQFQFILCNFLTVWNRSCESINCQSYQHILRCYIRRNRAFCE